jgi:hypothetical protein
MESKSRPLDQENSMKYFPKLEDLDPELLRSLYRLRRFDEWDAFTQLMGTCRTQMAKQLESESLIGNATTIFRDIGALAFTGELQEFLEAAEDYLKLLSGTGGTQNERNF